MDVDTSANWLGEAGFEPTATSQTPPPSAPNSPASLQLYHTGLASRPESNSPFNHVVELESAFKAKLAIALEVETETELPYAPPVEIQVEPQADAEVETEVIPPAIGLVDPYPHDKKIPVWAVVRTGLISPFWHAFTLLFV